MYEIDANDKYTLTTVEKNIDTLVEYIDKTHKINET